MKKSKAKIAIIAVIAVVIVLAICFLDVYVSPDLKSIHSKNQLKRMYDGDFASDSSQFLLSVFGMPWSFFISNSRVVYSGDYYMTDGLQINESVEKTAETTSSSSEAKNYSTTNIQVENVDEADIIKTDGDYIYSISEYDVIISDVRDPKDIKISAQFQVNGGVPVDLILYDNKLVVIAMTETLSNSYYYYNNSDTVVAIYDITDKTHPQSIKSYTLYEPYYTSRCIDNNLYVISSGRLREDDNDDIIISYEEDFSRKDIDLKNIKYLPEVDTRHQTLISYVDLSNLEKPIDVSSYLLDISNAYVSENNIYLLDYEYDYSDTPPLKTLFGFAGAIGPFIYDDNDDSSYKTKIYKFEIEDNGKIQYDGKTKINGKTINQFSLDEYNGNLRVALYDWSEGSRVVVLDKDLNVIGESENLAKGEQMYSSRFIGNKAYLVTYLNTDPLFVIDLSNPENPTVLGELKIPGYSTYLHPYDENHLIGIGMDSEEVIRRDNNGKILSTSANITGMKMALFDVSDVNNPTQISSVRIGDRRATSAILTNHKALLFSKEKELIAIPVNNYDEDFVLESSYTSQDDIVHAYTSYNKNYVSEGYFVYNINTTDGFRLKGVVNHEKTPTKYYWQSSRLLRGLYIEDNLFTVSETAIKVNSLNDLSLIDELKID